jgi:hypothetical protein
MTAADDARVPAALRERLGAVRGDLTDASVLILRDVLAADPMTRAQALDLLTADALVTRAFEDATSEPATLVARADDAMRHIAALAADEP